MTERISCFTVTKADRIAADRVLTAAVSRAVALTKAGEARAVVVALLTAAATAAEVLLDAAVQS